MAKNKKEFFTITRVSRDDIVQAMYNSPYGDRIGMDTVKKLAERMTDKEMEQIAKKMGEAYVESGAFWDTLAMLVEENIKGEDACHKCGSTDKGLTENDSGKLTCDDCWE